MLLLAIWWHPPQYLFKISSTLLSKWVVLIFYLAYLWGLLWFKVFKHLGWLPGNRNLAKHVWTKEAGRFFPSITETHLERLRDVQKNITRKKKFQFIWTTLWHVSTKYGINCIVVVSSLSVCPAFLPRTTHPWLLNAFRSPCDELVTKYFGDLHQLCTTSSKIFLVFLFGES